MLDALRDWLMSLTTFDTLLVPLAMAGVGIVIASLLSLYGHRHSPDEQSIDPRQFLEPAWEDDVEAIQTLEFVRSIPESGSYRLGKVPLRLHERNDI